MQKARGQTGGLVGDDRVQAAAVGGTIITGAEGAGHRWTDHCVDAETERLTGLLVLL